MLELLGLGIDDGADVALVGMEGFEVLVVIFGRVEFLQRGDLGGDGVFPLLLHFDLGGFGDLVLLLGGVVDGGAVLAAVVVALVGGAFGQEFAVMHAVFLGHAGGVMRVPEEVDDFLVADDGGIELDLDDFGMAGVSGADVFIGGIFGFAAGVAADDILDAFNKEILRLHAPEAATTDNGGFRFGGVSGRGGRGEGGHEKEGEKGERGFHGIDTNELGRGVNHPSFERRNFRRNS